MLDLNEVYNNIENFADDNVELSDGSKKLYNDIYKPIILTLMVVTTPIWLAVSLDDTWKPSESNNILLALELLILYPFYIYLAFQPVGIYRLSFLLAPFVLRVVWKFLLWYDANTVESSPEDKYQKEMKNRLDELDDMKRDMYNTQKEQDRKRYLEDVKKKNSIGDLKMWRVNYNDMNRCPVSKIIYAKSWAEANRICQTDPMIKYLQGIKEV